MRTIETEVYFYHELNDDAKQRAREWFLRDGFQSERAWEQVQEDAKDIGLRIASLDQHRANRGTFVTSALDCARKITANHGETCETYTTAKAYLKDREAIPCDDDGDFIDGDEADNLTEEFLQSLLEDYRSILDKDIEYFESEEAVAESMEANEYEFTETGERI